MFEPGTILRLREPQSTDDAPYPYDLVEVVGQSPIQHATRGDSPWAGQDAFGYIIKPADEFGATLDKPFGELNKLYTIESYPTDPATGQPITPENSPRHQPSPEQVFAKIADEQEAVRQRPRVPSVQNDAKSPEQVLREAATEPAPSGRGRRAKPKEDKPSE